jgi:hypothetical protein
MASNRIFLFIALLITGLYACKLSYGKQILKHNIYFGSSGGFTGARDEYVLKGSGNLYKINSSTNDTTFVKKADSKATRDIFKRAESETLLGINLNQPGNMNHFINIYDEAGLVKGFLWTEGSTLPQELNQFNALLNNFIKE